MSGLTDPYPQTWRYSCWDCGTEFAIAVTEAEARSSLAPGRGERCPGCGCLVGRGHIKCHSCSTRHLVEVGHWHVGCDTYAARCPVCGSEAKSLCAC